MNTPYYRIRFILDGQIVEEDFKHHRPTTTVLQYLRSLANHQGTKEGCAEGDCGACTVVIAKLDESEKIVYRAYDSCLIFLPMLDGQQLITVENLGSATRMHPVQQAMVETGGSQCGYCTPGIVMSLFSLYKNHQHPSRGIIDDALTGNLCRCTGYRPIVEAAIEACTQGGLDQFSQDQEMKDLLIKLQGEQQSLHIETKKQQYYRPQSLQEALRLKDEHREALWLCGATDLALRVTKQKELLEQIIDLSALEASGKIEEFAKYYHIDAWVSLEKVKAFSENRLAALYDMLSVFGSLQIRNLATLGGNLGSASPIGDTPPVLMAYDATVGLESVEGKRAFSVRDFITGYRQTQLKPNEMITYIRIPKLSARTQVKAYKISRRKDLDISTVSAGFRLDLDSANRVQKIALIYGGMAAMTQSATHAEEYLLGKSWTREVVMKAMPLIDEAFTPISDARANAVGRRVMARNLLLKFWVDTKSI